MIYGSHDRWPRQVPDKGGGGGGSFFYDPQIEHIVEIVKNRLFFGSTYSEQGRTLAQTVDTVYFSTDDDLLYMNYYFDFGPLNLSCLYKFCYKLNSFLQRSASSTRVVYYTSADSKKRANAAYLIGCFAVLYLDIPPKRIYQILISAGGVYKNFVDASQGLSAYTLRLVDCFQAIEKARAFNFFDFNDFNCAEYDTYDRIQNGDMNWLLPRKFIAFIGPTDCEFMNGHPPEFYLKYFVKNDVKTVIRLNNKVYDASAFAQAGISHYELFFADGTTPSNHILLRFLDISEHSPAAVAVHCKAGLGRTGSLIGAYIIKHYHMTAREAIAWMRICRPGSVIGQQQGWLEKMEAWLWKQGNKYRIEHFGDGDKILRHRYGVYSKEWPQERKRIILMAQRSALDGEEKKYRMSSPQRYSAPPQKAMNAAALKHKRPESERKRTQADRERETYRFNKLISKAQMFNDENRSVNAISRSRHANCQTEKTRGPRNAGELEEYRRKRHKEKMDAEKTQGDRLNEIKAQRFGDSAKAKTSNERRTSPAPKGAELEGGRGRASSANASALQYYLPTVQNAAYRRKRNETGGNNRTMLKNAAN